jgi:hypothetical protein
MKAHPLMLWAALALPALAEIRDEEHLVGDELVRITVAETLEILTVGRLGDEQMEVLSGADVEIVWVVDDAASVAMVGKPLVLVEVTGTHSCEDGDARAYFVVTLGDAPKPEGPVTTCAALTASVTPGALLLAADPAGDTGEFWAWKHGRGWGPTVD